MSEFVKGFVSCLCGAVVFGAFLAIAYLYRRRYPRTRELDVLDYDNGTPDGWVRHFKEEKQ